MFRPLTRELMREHPEEGAEPRAGAARPQGPRVGGGVGGLGAGVPAREGLLAGDGRAAPEARHRPVPDRPAGGDHRRAALPRGRPVRLRAQRRPRDPGRVRRSRQRRGRQSARRRATARRSGRRPARDDPRARRAAAELRRPAGRASPRVERDARLDAVGGPEGRAVGRADARRRFLDAARSPRHAGASGADGSREGGGGDGASLCATRLAKGTERTGKSFARAGRRASPCSSICVSEGIRDVLETRADRGGARGRAGLREAERATRRRGAWCGQLLGHVPRLGRQPAHAAHRDRRRRRSATSPGC